MSSSLSFFGSSGLFRAYWLTQRSSENVELVLAKLVRLFQTTFWVGARYENRRNAVYALFLIPFFGTHPPFDDGLAGAGEGEFVVFDIAGNRAARAGRHFVAEGDGGD